MARAHSGRRTIEDVRRDLESERDQLATAAGRLRGSIDVSGKMRSKLPVLAAGAAGLGFFLAGGIGATARLLLRRGREGSTKARVGRFRISD